MKNKVLLLILGAILLVVIVVAVVVQPSNKLKKTTSVETKNAVSKSVVYDGKVFAPNSVALKKGNIISVFNSSGKKVMVEIINKTSSNPHPILTIDSGKAVSSPAIEEDGVYVFKDISTQVNGKISPSSAQPGASAPTTVSPAPLVVSKGIATITDNGVTPGRVDVAVGNSLQIINKTNSDVTLAMTGMINKSIVVGAGKTVNSEVFNQAGEIKAVASNNKSVTSIVEVK